MLELTSKSAPFKIGRESSTATENILLFIKFFKFTFVILKYSFSLTLLKLGYSSVTKHCM